MERIEIVNEIKSIFKEVFPELNQLDLEKKNDLFENWDSFSHLEIVSKVEK